MFCPTNSPQPRHIQTKLVSVWIIFLKTKRSDERLLQPQSVNIGASVPAAVEFGSDPISYPLANQLFIKDKDVSLMIQSRRLQLPAVCPFKTLNHDSLTLLNRLFSSIIASLAGSSCSGDLLSIN